MISKEKFIEMALARYDKVKSLEKIKSYYEYEKAFDELWTEYGREALEKSISQTPNDRRKKKPLSLRKH